MPQREAAIPFIALEKALRPEPRVGEGKAQA